MIVAVLVGKFMIWYLGLAIFLLSQLALIIFGYSSARCPRCGQVWWSGMGTIAAVGGWFAVAESAEQEDETESFVCRRCRLDLGLGMRD